MKFLISLLLSSLACGCVSATITDPSVCDNRVVAFPGSSSFTGAPMTQSFSLSLGPNGVDKIILLNGQLSRDDGGDFSFLDEVMISVADPHGNDDLVIWDSQHNDTDVLPITATDANLANYIDSNNNFTINATVSTKDPPGGGWDLVVSLCVSVEANKTFQ